MLLRISVLLKMLKLVHAKLDLFEIAKFKYMQLIVDLSILGVVKKRCNI